MFSIFVIMSKQKNIEKLLFKTFDEDIKGADIYNNDGSMWIIFTEKRKWIVEFTKAGTLWYNYRHFTDILIYFGMELDEGSKYIKKWYEERFLFKPKIVEDTIDNGVKRTDYFGEHEDYEIEDIIENGVKETTGNINNREGSVENTIQNGVKNSQSFDGKSLKLVEDAIQNGVKNTQWGYLRDPWVIENIVQNGVKDVTALKIQPYNVDDVLRNGVKHIEVDYEGHTRIGDTIEKGVKETRGWPFTLRLLAVEDTIQKGVKRTSSRGPFSDGTVEDAIKYGVKHIDYSILGSLYQKDHNVTTLDFTSKLEDTIQNGVKEVKSVYLRSWSGVEDAIQNGVKHCEDGDWLDGDERFEDIIENGVKHMMWSNDDDDVKDVIKNGVKLKN